jgi:hypothetical protein
VTKPKEYHVYLRLEDLLLLDGKVEDKVQRVIDVAKQEASFGFDSPVLNEIMRLAETEGKLEWWYKEITSCPLCDKKLDYYTYPRSGRYHRRGDKNYDKPKKHSGVTFFRMSSIHICRTCWDTLAKSLLIDYILDNDLKIEIPKNDYRDTRYVKDPSYTCFNCTAEIYESEMGLRPTLIGGGYYPAVCPNCGEVHKPLGRGHTLTGKFRLLEKNSSQQVFSLDKK